MRPIHRRGAAGSPRPMRTPTFRSRTCRCAYSQRRKALPAAALKRVGSTVRMVGVAGRDPSMGVTFEPKGQPYEYETSDLVQKALRLSPDGRGQGFVYFDAAARRETGVWFELTAVNTSTGENLGRLILPVGVRELEGDPKKPAPLKKQPIERRPAGIQ